MHELCQLPLEAAARGAWLLAGVLEVGSHPIFSAQSRSLSEG